MKRIFLFISIAASLLFSYQATAGCCSSGSKRRVKRTYKRVKRPRSSKRLRSIRQTQAKNRLNEIYDLYACLNARKNIPDNRKHKYQTQLNERLHQFRALTRNVRNLPFADRLQDLPALVSEIQTAKIKFENCAGKDERYIIKRLRQAQLRVLHNASVKEF